MRIAREHISDRVVRTRLFQSPNPDPEFTLFPKLESEKIRLPYSFITLLRQDFQILIRILILFEIEN